MYDIFSILNAPAFLISFSFGLFYSYLTFPEKRIILRHPTPNNAGKIIYRDNSDNCFKYMAKEVKCSNNTNEHPVDA